MNPDTVVTLGDIIILVISLAMLFAIIFAWRDRKQYHNRLTFLEMWKTDHDTWASARSDVLNQQVLLNQRLATLLEVMDKRVGRMEEYHWDKDGEKK